MLRLVWVNVPYKVKWNKKDLNDLLEISRVTMDIREVSAVWRKMSRN